MPLARVTSCQVTGCANVPEKRTPLGIPFVPFPVIVKLPPAAKAPPICNEPLVRTPVEKLTLPSVPVIKPLPDNPFAAVRVEPESDNPALLPTRIPPELLKSTLLLAEATSESERTNAKSRVTFVSDIFAP